MRVRRSTLTTLVAVLLTVACADDANSPHQPGSAVSFVILSGGDQTGTVGQELPLPVRVLATDASGQPVPNVVVNFVVTAGGGSVYAGSALTDASGVAADIWRLGTVAGSAQALEVRAVDASGAKHTYGTFTATATAGNPASVTTLAGDGQSAVVNTPVPIAPSVKLLDGYGNPVPNYPVTFVATLGGGVVTGSPAATDAGGVAAPTSWILGPVAGSNVLTATVTGATGSPVNFTATGLPAVVLHLALTTPPPLSVQNGMAFGTPPKVQLLDPQDNPVTQSGIPITVTLNGPGGILGGPVIVNTDGTGAAEFDNLVITGTMGGYTLSFQGPGLSPITTGTIVLTAGAPTMLTLSAGDGQSANVGDPVPIAPAVLVTDQSGNPVLGASVTFSVTSGAGSVTGSPAISDIDGIARVGSWTLGTTSTANGLIATSAALPGVSVTFTATGIVPVGNFWTTLNAPMPLPRRWTAYGVINDVLYVEGGRADAGVLFRLESFNPSTNLWSRRSDPPRKREGAVAGVINDKLYVVSGKDYAGRFISNVDVYNPATNSWAVGAPIPEAKQYAAAAVVNGILYVAGGGSPTGFSSKMYAYDPSTNAWSQKASMPMPLMDLVGVSLGNLFYTVGGTILGVGSTDMLMAYDPATDTWTSKAPMPRIRKHFTVDVLGGKLIAIDGMAGGQGAVTTDVDIYDPVTDSWSPGAPNAVARRGAATGVIGGQLYLTGGQTDSGSNTGVTEVYTP